MDLNFGSTTVQRVVLLSLFYFLIGEETRVCCQGAWNPYVGRTPGPSDFPHCPFLIVVIWDVGCTHDSLLELQVPVNEKCTPPPST